MHFQDIRKKTASRTDTRTDGRTNERTDNVKTVYPPPHFQPPPKQSLRRYKNRKITDLVFSYPGSQGNTKYKYTKMKYGETLYGCHTVLYTSCSEGKWVLGKVLWTQDIHSKTKITESVTSGHKGIENRNYTNLKYRETFYGCQKK